MARLDGRDAVPALVVLGPAQVGPQVEELVLDRRELRSEPVGQAERQRDPDRRVQLVDRAVRAHPRGVLGHAPAPAEARQALVAGLGVDPVSRQASAWDRIVQPNV